MSPEEFDNEVSQLEVNLDRLRALYEQYFLGIERIEPTVARKTVDRQFWQLKRVTMRNTARRFRFQTLVQRYNTLQQHWMKVCRQIENGTYPRHVKRAKALNEELTIAAKRRAQRVKKTATPAPAEPPPDSISELLTLVPPKIAPPDVVSSAPEPAAAARGAKPPPPRRKKAEPETVVPGTPTETPSVSNANPRRITLRPISEHDALKIRSSIPPAPAAPRGAPPPRKREVKHGDRGANEEKLAMLAQHNANQPITDARVDGLYRELQRVQRRLNQEEMDISVEALSRSLRATEARLKAKYAGKRVDFRVEVFNGKAVIKPSVRK